MISQLMFKKCLYLLRLVRKILISLLVLKSCTLDFARLFAIMHLETPRQCILNFFLIILEFLFPGLKMAFIVKVNIFVLRDYLTGIAQLLF